MKKIAFIFTILLISALLGCNPFKSLETKTQELWNTDQKEAVINLLEKEIQSSPENVKAHMLLGEYYLKLEKYKEADSRFNAVMRLTTPGSIEQKNAQTKICQFYKEILIRSAENNKISYILLDNLLGKLKTYNFSITTAEADEYLSKGAEKLWEDLGSAQTYLGLALFAGNDYQEKIQNIVLSEIKKMPIDRSGNAMVVEIHRIIMEKFHLTDELRTKIGLALIERAKKSIEFKIPVVETEHAAKYFLEEEKVNMALAPFDGRDIWINLEPNQEKIIGTFKAGDKIIYNSTHPFSSKEDDKAEKKISTITCIANVEMMITFGPSTKESIITFKGGKEKTRINYKIITKK